MYCTMLFRFFCNITIKNTTTLMALISIVVIENIRRDFNESVAEHEAVAKLVDDDGLVAVHLVS